VEAGMRDSQRWCVDDFVVKEQDVNIHCTGGVAGSGSLAQQDIFYRVRFLQQRFRRQQRFYDDDHIQKTVFRFKSPRLALVNR